MKPTLFLPTLLAFLPACERVADRPQYYREEPKIVTRSTTTTTLSHARRTSHWFNLTQLPVVTNAGHAGVLRQTGAIFTCDYDEYRKVDVFFCGFPHPHWNGRPWFNTVPSSPLYLAAFGNEMYGYSVGFGCEFRVQPSLSRPLSPLRDDENPDPIQRATSAFEATLAEGPLRREITTIDVPLPGEFHSTPYSFLTATISIRSFEFQHGKLKIGVESMEGKPATIWLSQPTVVDQIDVEGVRYYP